jgi:hypothetical protein
MNCLRNVSRKIANNWIDDGLPNLSTNVFYRRQELLTRDAQPVSPARKHQGSGL